MKLFNRLKYTIWMSPLLIAFLQVASAQEVYVGTADFMNELFKKPTQWKYVQKNADGFYINFIMLNRFLRHATGLQNKDLRDICSLFSSHRAYFESDIRSPLPGQQGGGGGGKHDGASLDDDRNYIKMIHEAGCSLANTSLNYGWSQERADNLTQYEFQKRMESALISFKQPHGL